MIYIEAPREYTSPTIHTMFLAGGISNCPDWQQDMVDKLKDTGLVLYNPRRENFPMGDPEAGLKQIVWEDKYLAKCNYILFWFPKETICPIVLFELGSWSMTQKRIFVGCHPDYVRKFDVEIQMKLRRPDVEIVYSLDDLATQIIESEKS